MEENRGAMSIPIEIWEKIEVGFTLPPLNSDWQGGRIENRGGVSYYVYTRLPIERT